MVDVVTLLILLYAFAISFIGVMEEIVSISTILRASMLFIPTLVFYKKKLSVLIVLGCETLIVALRAILVLYLQKIKFLGEDGIYNITNVLLKKPTGLLDFITVTIYFIVVCFVIHSIIKENLVNVNSMTDIKIKQKYVIDNFISMNATSIIAFFITGIWDYNLKDSISFVLVYSVAFFIVYVYSKRMIDELYIESIQKYKSSDKYTDYSKEVVDLNEWGSS